MRHTNQFLFILVLALSSTTLGGLFGSSQDTETKARRKEVIKNGKVWVEPKVAIRDADLSMTDPTDGKDKMSFDEDTVVECKWIWNKMGGASRKFFCETPDGTKLKVRYNLQELNRETGDIKIVRGNPEIFAGALSQRLLRALGFGGNRIFIVKTVRCYGCPENPREASDALLSDDPTTKIQWIKKNGGTETIENGVSKWSYSIDYSKSHDFRWVGIDRKMYKKEYSLDIGRKEKAGWGFNEIDNNTGSSKAQIDAIKIMAAFLNHQDNKPDNQAVVCPTKDIRDDGSCDDARLIIGDGGSTFGSGFQLVDKKFKALPGYEGLQLDLWWKSCMWFKDKPSHRIVHIKSSPNGTLRFAKVSEEGREFLAGLLSQLSADQIVAMFKSVHLEEIPFENPEMSDPETWAQAFLLKRDQVINGNCN